MEARQCELAARHLASTSSETGGVVAESDSRISHGAAAGGSPDAKARHLKQLPDLPLPSAHMCWPRRQEYVAATQMAIDAVGACVVHILSDRNPGTDWGETRVSNLLSSAM